MRSAAQLGHCTGRQPLRYCPPRSILLGARLPPVSGKPLDDLRARERKRVRRVSSLSDSTSRLAPLACLRIGGFSHLARRVRSRHARSVRPEIRGGRAREIPRFVHIRRASCPCSENRLRRASSSNKRLHRTRTAGLLCRESLGFGARSAPVNRRPLCADARAKQKPSRRDRR
jgi:hypothetical protein